MNDRNAAPTAILCYHSHRREGSSYEKNDYTALGRDLEIINTLGINISSAYQIAQALTGQIPWETIAGSVAITFDDGSILDYRDFTTRSGEKHPALYQLLKKNNAHATSFVIASPNARYVLEEKSLNDEPMLSDDWWRSADADLIDIENHSWDHNHQHLPWPPVTELQRGNFFEINTEASADWEVFLAQIYIKSIIGRPPRLFAYPYGNVSKYLRDEYLPLKGEKIGLLGALSTGGELITPATYRWDIPRFVCGEHWTSPETLINLVLGKITDRKHN